MPLPRIIRKKATDTRATRQLHELFAGEYGAIVIEKVFSPEECAQIVRNVQTASIQWALSPEYLLAGGLLMFAKNKREYFEHKSALQACLGDLNILNRVREQFSRMCQGVQIYTFADGHEAAPFSIRELKPEGEIAIHSEHDRWPGMEDFHQTIDLSTQLSFYLQLRSGEAGGVLQFVRPTPDSIQWSIPMPATIPLDEGDIIIFDGGRINHQVSKLKGNKSRWTLGGFASLTLNILYIWS
jgi:hypothetical protein